jgi:type IV pilus assembly protein PilC
MTDNTQAFGWTGINKDGKRVAGVLHSADVKGAHAELNRMGVEIISLELKPHSSIKLFSRKQNIKPQEILLFTRYVSTMLAAGLPILQTLDIIAADQENPAMKNLIVTVKSKVEGGKTLAESFSQYPRQFGDLYCSLVKAGEISGTLDKTLIRLALYLERTEQLKRKIKKALVYPITIVAVALIVSLVLLIFVVPQFQALFKTFGAQLPLFTQMVVNFSHALRTYGWLMVLALIAGVYYMKHLFRTSEHANWVFDRAILKVHIIGPVLRNGIIARFARTLSTTVESGMPIIESMKAMAPVMGNRMYAKAILQICDEVASGNQLSAAMRSTGMFPNMSVQMIAVGEASGALSNMLNKIADYYEEEVNATVDNLSSLLEPLIMMVLGVVVGGFVIAMYLPIFKMGSLF